MTLTSSHKWMMIPNTIWNINVEQDTHKQTNFVCIIQNMYKIKLTISINQWGFKVNPAKNKNDRLKNGNISYFLKKKK